LVGIDGGLRVQLDFTLPPAAGLGGSTWVTRPVTAVVASQEAWAFDVLRHRVFMP
jgi:hypothetical protein